MAFSGGQTSLFFPNPWSDHYFGVAGLAGGPVDVIHHAIWKICKFRICFGEDYVDPSMKLLKFGQCQECFPVGLFCLIQVCESIASVGSHLLTSGGLGANHNGL